MGGTKAPLRPRVARLAVTLAVIGGLLAVLESPASADQTISSSGPLTSIRITPDLNCDVRHKEDTLPEFYGQTACATLIAVGDTLYGPSVIPAGDAAIRQSLTPVSQTAVTGAGTAANPYRIVTVVNVGSTGLRLQQTDSYVIGQESYRTDVQLTSTLGISQTAVVYRAGDCFLQDSDFGLGAVGPAPGAIACRNASGRVEQWLPITPGSHYMEGYFSDVWGWTSTRQDFPDTCTCETLLDNGAGLSWRITVPATGPRTVSSLITFSPTGLLPLSTAKSANVGTVAPGAANGYNITVTNPNAQTATLSTITDTLPEGFTYRPGSTSGITTADPTVAGRTLTWTGPFQVPTGTASLSFGVTAATLPGTYFNEADADGGTFSVAGTGPTAPVTVSGPPACTTTLSGTRVGPWTVGSGQHLCLTDGRFGGRVTLLAGGALTATNAQISGAVIASGASWIRLCGTSVGTALSSAGSPGPITIGDPAAGCAANRVSRSGVTLTDNTGVSVVAGNTIWGGIQCSGNAPAPVNNGQPNTLMGEVTRTGQCSAL